jgi:hypothetical protein
MQDRIKIDGWDAAQPSEYKYSVETTSTEDSGRVMSGTQYDTPMFTVEAFDVVYKNLSAKTCSELLKRIVKKPGKPYFTLHYFSPYYGVWRNAQFGVSQGTLNIQSLEKGDENVSEVSCRFVGRYPL